VIFVDSSFWIAQQLERDEHHADAKVLEETRSGDVLVTSNAVVAETWTYLRRKAGHSRAMAWLDRVRAAPLTVERVDRSVEDQAWAWLRDHDERPYSFVDAASFALMRKLRIREALAFDGDFAAAGFVELRS
jgi:predicted nucleic acid-binding protein